MKYSHSIKALRKHGLEVFELVILGNGQVIHTSTHMSQGGAVTRFLAWKKEARA